MNIDLFTLWICSSVGQWLWITIVWVKAARCSREMSSLRMFLEAEMVASQTLHNYRESQ